LGEEEIRLTKEAIGLDPDLQFQIPEGVYDFFSKGMDRGRLAHAAWEERKAAALSDRQRMEEWSSFFDPGPVSLSGPGFAVGEKIATRAASGKVFGEVAAKVPGFMGGSADLVESTKTQIEHGRLFSKTDRAARDIAFGIREHAMGTIVNGIAVHGGLRPYGATFFVFSDYMRPAVRLSALMEAHSIWVWTHDSVFLGEDGPTHQPIEHLASLRAMPNLWVVRPADAGETIEAWELALNRRGPTALLLSRQNLPVLDRPGGGVRRGGYVLKEGTGVVLIATGSEVALALATANLLVSDGVEARVVSLPCWEAFLAEDEDYRSQVLGVGIPRVSIEAGSTFGWERIVGSDGLMIGIDRFGASAPAERLATEFGFTPEAVRERVLQLLR
jgi:transketolase